MLLFVFSWSDERRRAERSSLHFLLAAEEGKERLTLTRKLPSSHQKPWWPWFEALGVVCVCDGFLYCIKSCTYSMSSTRVCLLYRVSLWGMRQVLQFNSKHELMGDERYGCLGIARHLGSKQTWAAGRVHGEFKSLEENIKPSLMISDEEIAGRFLFLFCRRYLFLQGRDYTQVGFASSNLPALCYSISSAIAKTSRRLLWLLLNKIFVPRPFSTSPVLAVKMTWDMTGEELWDHFISWEWGNSHFKPRHYTH